MDEAWCRTWVLADSHRPHEYLGDEAGSGFLHTLAAGIIRIKGEEYPAPSANRLDNETLLGL